MLVTLSVSFCLPEVNLFLWTWVWVWLGISLVSGDIEGRFCSQVTWWGLAKFLRSVCPTSWKFFSVDRPRPSRGTAVARRSPVPRRYNLHSTCLSRLCTISHRIKRPVDGTITLQPLLNSILPEFQMLLLIRNRPVSTHHSRKKWFLLTIWKWKTKFGVVPYWWVNFVV